ncbi:MAG: hypothetical protein J2P24_07960 [Streptosporangiales bacterium]|nr:hypothetical protein [Streptosporangiales bacterium]MBO0890475.1 hypothetical protein [Acidothermales bacterium]
MSVARLVEIAAWVLAAAIALWMVVDVIRVDHKYDEEYLSSAVEDLSDAPNLEGDPTR